MPIEFQQLPTNGDSCDAYRGAYRAARLAQVKKDLRNLLTVERLTDKERRELAWLIYGADVAPDGTVTITNPTAAGGLSHPAPAADKGRETVFVGCDWSDAGPDHPAEPECRCVSPALHEPGCKWLAWKKGARK